VLAKNPINNVIMRTMRCSLLSKHKHNIQTKIKNPGSGTSCPQNSCSAPTPKNLTDHFNTYHFTICI